MNVKKFKKIKFRIFREKTIKKIFASKVFPFILISIFPTYEFFRRLWIAFQTCTRIFLIITWQPCPIVKVHQAHAIPRLTSATQDCILWDVKAGTDYGTYSAAQPDAAAKNMMFACVDSQQICCKHAMNMFRGRAVLPRNEPKIVGFQDKRKGIPCRRMLVRPSCGGSLCHKHFFANFRTSCSWLPWRLCRRICLIVCTGLMTSPHPRNKQTFTKWQDHMRSCLAVQGAYLTYNLTDDSE